MAFFTRVNLNVPVLPSEELISENVTTLPLLPHRRHMSEPASTQPSIGVSKTNVYSVSNNLLTNSTTNSRTNSAAVKASSSCCSSSSTSSNNSNVNSNISSSSNGGVASSRGNCLAKKNTNVSVNQTITGTNSDSAILKEKFSQSSSSVGGDENNGKECQTDQQPEAEVKSLESSESPGGGEPKRYEYVVDRVLGVEV